MNTGSIIPPGIERPYTFGYNLKQESKRIQGLGQRMKLAALQEQFLVYKSLGKLGAKGMVDVSKRANQLAKQTLSPLEYARSKGTAATKGLFSFQIDV